MPEQVTTPDLASVGFHSTSRERKRTKITSLTTEILITNITKPLLPSRAQHSHAQNKKLGRAAEKKYMGSRKTWEAGEGCQPDVRKRHPRLALGQDKSIGHDGWANL